nr:hypothetical protein [Tanacetum cinerariifolium]
VAVDLHLIFHLRDLPFAHLAKAPFGGVKDWFQRQGYKEPESDTEMPEKHVSPTPHDVMLTRHSTSGHSLSGHASPDTTIANSSTLPRFVYPSLARTLQCSEVYLCWRPSHKRCRSPATIVTSSIHDTRGLVHSHADLLLPCKRFRDSISLEDSVEEDIDAYEMADIKADATAVEVVVDRDVEAEVDACIGIEVDVRINVEDEVESNDRSTIDVRVDVVGLISLMVCLYPMLLSVWSRLRRVAGYYDHVIEIPIQRIKDIKTR